MRKTIVSFFICLCAFGAAATVPDNWKTASKADVLAGYQKAMDWFAKTGNYKITVAYASYTDHTTTSAFDQSSGYYIRNGKNVHSCMMGMHTIQNDRLRFAVDTVNKMIVLNDAGEVGKTLPDMNALSGLLDHVQSVQKLQLANGGSSYKITFKPNELYSAYEFELNEKGLLTKLKYFYSTELAEENDEEIDSDAPVKKEMPKSRPRLEVTFSNYETAFVPNYEKEFSEKKYLKAQGNKLIATEKYAAYTLKDYRSPVKK